MKRRRLDPKRPGRNGRPPTWTIAADDLGITIRSNDTRFSAMLRDIVPDHSGFAARSLRLRYDDALSEIVETITVGLKTWKWKTQERWWCNKLLVQLRALDAEKKLKGPDYRYATRIECGLCGHSIHQAPCNVGGCLCP